MSNVRNLTICFIQNSFFLQNRRLVFQKSTDKPEAQGTNTPEVKAEDKDNKKEPTPEEVEAKKTVMRRALQRTEENRSDLGALRKQIGEVPQTPEKKDDKAKSTLGEKKDKPKVPERAPDAMTGQQFTEALKQCKTPEQRRELIIGQAAKGALNPESLKERSYTTNINGQEVKVLMSGTLEVGVPGDSVRLTADDATSQALADMLGGTLPPATLYQRLYNDPTVQKVPFFTGELLQAAVNKERLAKGLLPLNINNSDGKRNGDAMQSADYTAAHSKALDEWLQRHGIDRSTLMVGSRKTVFAPDDPEAKDGKIVFGGGLYAIPIVDKATGKVDYRVSNELVQGIGDHAHEHIFYDGWQGTDVTLGIDYKGERISMEKLYSDPKYDTWEYKALRTQLFGPNFSLDNRYKYPSWMKEQIGEYQRRPHATFEQNENNTDDRPAGALAEVPRISGKLVDFKAMKDENVTPEIHLQATECLGQFLSKYHTDYKQHYGEYIEFTTDDGKTYRGVLLQHYHLPGGPAKPWGPHPGITVFEQLASAGEQGSGMGPAFNPNAVPEERRFDAAVTTEPEKAPASEPKAPKLPGSTTAYSSPVHNPSSAASSYVAPAYVRENTPPALSEAVPAPEPAVAPTEEHEAEEKLTGVAKGSVGIFGDSISVLRADRDHNMTSGISDMPQIKVTETKKTWARGGETSKWLLRQVQNLASSSPEEIKKLDHAIILIGTNDIGAMDSQNAKEPLWTDVKIFERIKEIWAVLKAVNPNIKIYACTIPPFKGYSYQNYGQKFDEVNGKRKNINAWIKEAKTLGLIYDVIDLCKPVDQGGLASSVDDDNAILDLSVRRPGGTKQPEGDKVHPKSDILADIYQQALLRGSHADGGNSDQPDQNAKPVG